MSEEWLPDREKARQRVEDMRRAIVPWVRRVDLPVMEAYADGKLMTEDEWFAGYDHYGQGMGP